MSPTMAAADLALLREHSWGYHDENAEPNCSACLRLASARPCALCTETRCRCTERGATTRAEKESREDAG